MIIMLNLALRFFIFLNIESQKSNEELSVTNRMFLKVFSIFLLVIVQSKQHHHHMTLDLNVENHLNPDDE